MSSGKLRSDEVPQKFIEWLLPMGYPDEKIPSLEKMTRMCRAQYYMVWRSLLEHAQAVDVIRLKRLTVFYDDIKICQEMNLLKEGSVGADMPVQLSLWRDHTDLKQKVTEAESQVLLARVALNKIIEKTSFIVSQRNGSRQRIQNLERRSWLLRQVASNLKAKISNIDESLSIADSLCNVNGKLQDDIQNNVDKCMEILQKKKSCTTLTLPLSTPIASSSIVSNHENDTASNDKDDHVLSLINRRGDILWPHLCERHAEVYRQLPKPTPTGVRKNRYSVRQLLANIAALHSTLALEVIKNKVKIQRTVDKSAASIEDIIKYESEDTFELLETLLRIDYNEARVESLRKSLEELTSESGVFACGGDQISPFLDEKATLGKVASVNKCVVNTRDELESLITSLESIRRKIINIRECLLAFFSALHNNTTVSSERCWGVQLNLPVESISLLCQYFAKRRDGNRVLANLSWNLDMSDSAFEEDNITDNPRHSDELNVYLEKFKLEKNRKIVIDSGEKIWIFETLQALSSKLHAQWLNDGVTPMLCPAVRPSRTIRYLYETLGKEALIRFSEVLNTKHTCDYSIDITAISQQEADQVDKIKKKIRDTLYLLQQVDKNLDTCHENLQFWSEHQLKKYISANRIVDGKTYNDFERLYLERLKFNW